jgi:hypothetical protein
VSYPQSRIHPQAGPVSWRGVGLAEYCRNYVRITDRGHRGGRPIGSPPRFQHVGRHRQPPGACGVLYARPRSDAAALKQRVTEMARGVCENDPRTIDQRRADAMGALANGADRLACACGGPECLAAENAAPGATVVHVIAEERTLSDDTPVQLDGEEPDRPSKPLREMTLAEALTPPPPTGPAHTNPAVVIGGGIMPAPLLAAKLANTATIRPLIHPGDAPPEPRYVPTRALADFVRCRDLPCRFPGWDEPADVCDRDHTIAYPVGPTCASNLKCLCRKHHLLKTHDAPTFPFPSLMRA